MQTYASHPRFPTTGLYWKDSNENRIGRARN